MKNMIVSFLVSAVTLIIASKFLDGFEVASFGSAIWASVVIGVANVLIRPILFLFTLPINILTLGLFTFVLNGIILKMVAAVVEGFVVTTWTAAILGAVVIAVVSGLIFAVLPKSIDGRE